MENFIHSGRRVDVFITLIFVFILMISSIHLISNEVRAEEIDKDLPTRSEESTVNISNPDFDIQFMLDPSTDPLDPFFGEKWGKMEPGSQAEYCVLIVNMGSENDIFHIGLNDPPPETEWDWYFLETGNREADVDLVSPEYQDLHGGKSFKVLMIRIECPLDALKKAQISVELNAYSFRSLTNENINLSEDHDELKLVIGCSHGFSIRPHHPTIFHAKPDEWMTIPFKLTNLGNKDIIDVVAYVEEGDFWRTNYRDFESHYLKVRYLLEFNWTEFTIKIPQGETFERDLKFRIPSEICHEDFVYQFRYVARIQGTNYWTKSDIITVIADRTSTLSINESFPEEIGISPGIERKINMTIVNSGWEAGVISDINLIGLNGVALKAYNESGGEIHGMTIPERSKRNITLGFYVDDRSAPGWSDYRISLSQSHFDPIERSVRLNIMKVKDLELIPSDPIVNGKFSIGPDQIRNMIVGVRNNGNTVRDFYMNMLGSDWGYESLSPEKSNKKWSSSIKWISQVQEPINFLKLDLKYPLIDTGDFHNDIGYLFGSEMDEGASIRIDPGEIVWFCFRMGSPDGIGGMVSSEKQISIFLVDIQNETSCELEILLTVKYPDLDFQQKIQFFDEFGNDIYWAEADQIVSFRINLTNSGEYYSGETEMVIWIGKKEIGRYTIDPLGPDEVLVLEGNFTAISGIDDLVIELDPSNDVIESDDQFTKGSSEEANIDVIDFNVKGGKDESNWLQVFLIFLVIFTFGILIVVSALIFSRFLSKRDDL